MFIYGVIDASLDPIDDEARAASTDDAVERASDLLADGANGIELVGPGSAGPDATASWESEWTRLSEIVPAVATLGVPVSVATARPVVARLALEHGASAINAVEDSWNGAMAEAVSPFEVSIAIRFEPDATNGEEVVTDPVVPIEALTDFFTVRLATAERDGIRDRCVVDPGAALVSASSPVGERSALAALLASRLHALREFGLPVSVALPSEDDARHDDLLGVLFDQRVEFGRTADPSAVRRFEQRRHG